MSEIPGVRGRWATWLGFDLNHVAPEPFLWSLAKYRQSQDRKRVGLGEANLVSSRDSDGKPRLIIDIDVPHQYVESPTEGHGHLFLDVRMSWWRWVLVMVALRLGGVIEEGFLFWSLRRGENFVRLPGVPKDHPLPPPTEYGWLFPRRRRRS